jgi:hypothetical protein
MLNPFIFFSDEEREDATWFSGLQQEQDGAAAAAEGID